MMVISKKGYDQRFDNSTNRDRECYLDYRVPYCMKKA